MAESFFTPPRTIKRRSVSKRLIDAPADLHPVLARIYAGRNLHSYTELSTSLAELPRPGLLKGVSAAVQILQVAISHENRILILGDFDADGATSCALTVLALKAMGAVHTDYLVPNRFEYGYGLTPQIVTEAAKRKPDVIVTVDNGISSVNGVDAAHELGMKVIVTDHHLPGSALPAADAIVNPNQPGDGFPSKNLAGVGVIFYVLSALRAALRDSGWFSQKNIAEPNMARYLDLVALGTVADVVPLDRANRTLVAQGLARINAGQCRPGVRALLELGKRQLGQIVASDLGFALGPRLNAAGRLDDMSLGIRCLLSDNEDEVWRIAQELDELNITRRKIETGMKEQALALLPTLGLEGLLPAGLCLFGEDWHQGVIGILASRVREQTHRPVIAFAPGLEGEIKGSARSIEGLHIRDVLDAVATSHPGLLEKFGGHAMAAGLSLKREQFDDFKTAFIIEVERHLDGQVLENTILSDGELSEADLGIEFAETLRQAGPWGQAFAEPTFDGIFQVLQQRVVGQRHVKMVLQRQHSDQQIDAIGFNLAPEGQLPEWDQVHAAYRLDVNIYNGRRSAQLIIEHMEPC
ncbi:MAG: single-stranded-DNA-specific exonuclease RecJ [Gammaproteobacteria bacterium]|nr:single-stranded-DNA-specific exonuclease RecJ [Gammaproteobacteria bacterium]